MNALLKRLAGALIPELLLPDDVFAARVTAMWADVYGETTGAPGQKNAPEGGR